MLHIYPNTKEFLQKNKVRLASITLALTMMAGLTGCNLRGHDRVADTPVTYTVERNIPSPKEQLMNDIGKKRVQFDYYVVPGDNASVIADKFGSSMEEVLSDNGISKDELLPSGITLDIFTNEDHYSQFILKLNQALQENPDSKYLREQLQIATDSKINLSSEKGLH